MPTYLNREKTNKETLNFGQVLVEFSESISIANILKTFRASPKGIQLHPFAIILLLCAHAVSLMAAGFQLANKRANQNASKLARFAYHLLSIAIIATALAVIPALATTTAAALAMTVVASGIYFSLAAGYSLLKAGIAFSRFLVSPKNSFIRKHYGQKALNHLLTGLLYAGMALLMAFPPTQPVAVALLTIGLLYSIGRLILRASPTLKKWVYKKVGLEIKEEDDTSHTVKLSQQLGVANQTQEKVEREVNVEAGHFKSLLTQAHYPQVIERYLKQDKVSTAKAYLLEQLTNKIAAFKDINKPKQLAKHTALSAAKTLIENMESRAQASNPVTVKEIETIMDGKDDRERGLIRQSFFVNVGDTEDLLNACKVFVKDVHYELETAPEHVNTPTV